MTKEPIIAAQVRGARRIVATVLACALITAAGLYAEVGGNNAVSVTSTATTATLTTYVKTICITNASASTHKLFYRIFNNNEAPAAATTSSTRLEIGAYACHQHNSQSQANSLGWIGYSIVTDTAETATSRVVVQ